MTKSVQSPKKPSKSIGWSLIILGCLLSIVAAISLILIGLNISDYFGYMVVGAGIIFIFLPLPLIGYGRRRKAKRAEQIINELLESED